MNSWFTSDWNFRTNASLHYNGIIIVIRDSDFLLSFRGQNLYKILGNSARYCCNNSTIKKLFQLAFLWLELMGHWRKTYSPSQSSCSYAKPRNQKGNPTLVCLGWKYPTQLFGHAKNMIVKKVPRRVETFIME